MSSTVPTTDEVPNRPLRAQGGKIASGFRVVSVLTFLSRMLGMVRDMTMAYAFGAGPLMDAFTVAFRIPNLARRLFGEGALTTAFLPVFVREIELRGPDDARRVATAVTLTLAALLFGIVVIGEALLGLAWLVTPVGSDARTLILLTAQMLPYLLLVCLVAQLSAVLQSIDRFFWPSLLPSLLNVVWITAAFLALWLWTDPFQQIQVVAISVIVAGVMQVGVALWAAERAGFKLTRRWRSAMPQVREISGAMLPVMLGLSIGQLNGIVDNLLAWGLAQPSGVAQPGKMVAGIEWPLESGTASALFYAQRMLHFPTGVFGAALGIVLFPLLSRHVERGEIEQVGHDQTLGLRLTIAVGLPSSVGLVMLAERIAVLLFQRGAFTPDDAALTTRCVIAYGCVVWAVLGTMIMYRGFYAFGDRLTAIRCGLWSLGVNFVMNFVLIWPLAGSGLAWATSVAAVVNLVMTLVVYQRRYGLLNFAEVGTGLGRTLVATLAMTLACWLTMRFIPAGEETIIRILGVLGPITTSVVTYLLTARLIGLREPFLLLFRRADAPG